VTSVVLAPADSGLFCGTVAVIKTAGGDVDEMIVSPVAALKFSLGAGHTSIWQMRDLLEKAKKYHADWTEFDRRWAEAERKQAADPEADLDEPSRPRRDGELETLRSLFRDRTPVLVSASRTDQIGNALKVFREEYGLDVVVLGAYSGYRVASDLKAARVYAAVGPGVTWEERGREISLAAELSRAGVPVAFQSQGTSSTQFLRAMAARAVRSGMDAADALRGVTVRPAEALGLGRRIGCLEPGRDADLVVLSGDPLELTSRVEMVYVNGELAYDAEAGD